MGARSEVVGDPTFCKLYYFNFKLEFDLKL
jgi:hypothetical protein